MRPRYIRDKMKNKSNKKKFSQRRYKFCGCPGIPILDCDYINQIFRNDKLRLSRGRSSWKVMPKDSCEVYKERYKRQKKQYRRSHQSENNSQVTNKTKKRIVKKPPRKAKYNISGQKRRRRKKSSSCSCSSQSSCTCSRETET